MFCSPISLLCFTRILVMKGASLGRVSRAAFCFSSSFCPSRKYFWMNLLVAETTLLHTEAFITVASVIRDILLVKYSKT